MVRRVMGECTMSGYYSLISKSLISFEKVKKVLRKV
jgi:hypothetical protein